MAEIKFKTYLNYFGAVFYAVTLAFLLSDCFGYYASSIKYFEIDSRLIYNIFLVTQIIASVFHIPFMPESLVRINNKLIFPFSLTTFILLSVLSTFTTQNYIFSIFYISLENFKYVPFMSGVVLLANLKVKALESSWQKILLLGGIIFLICMNFLSVLNPELFKTLIKEDSLFENLQTLFYFSAAVFAFITSLKLVLVKKKVLFVFFMLLASILFFIAGEEISWGQRIFNLETPPIIDNINRQNELTIHNIKYFQSKIDYIYMFIGLLGAFSGLIAKKFFPKFYSKYEIAFPPLVLIFYFLAAFRYYFLNQFMVFSYQLFTFERISIGDRQEVSETLLAFGFMCFTYFVYKKQKNDQIKITK